MTGKAYNFAAPPAMAIAVGATTPNPGVSGAAVWSTTAGKVLIWDGSTWADPAASAGGGSVSLSDAAEALNADTTGLKLTALNYAERRMLAMSSALSVVPKAAQPLLGQGLVHLWSAAVNPSPSMFAWVESTAGTVAFAFANNGQSGVADFGVTIPRMTYSTTATAGTNGGNRVPNSIWGKVVVAARTYGFHYIVRFGIPASANGNPPARWFVGLTPSVNLGSVDPSTIASSVGFGCDSTDTEVQFMCNDGTTFLKSTLGTSYPGKTAKAFYEAHLFSGGNMVGKVGWMLRRLDVAPSTITSGVRTTGTPTGALSPYVYCNNAAVAQIQTIELSQQYFEHDC